MITSENRATGALKKGKKFGKNNATEKRLTEFIHKFAGRSEEDFIAYCKTSGIHYITMKKYLALLKKQNVLLRDVKPVTPLAKDESTIVKELQAQIVKQQEQINALMLRLSILEKVYKVEEVQEESNKPVVISSSDDYNKEIEVTDACTEEPEVTELIDGLPKQTRADRLALLDKLWSA